MTELEHLNMIRRATNNESKGAHAKAESFPGTTCEK